MTNKFNELSSDEMEEIQSDSSSSSDYKPDADMEKKGYEWDSSGLYKPYTFKHDVNPDMRDIYLKIERIPDLKTKFIKYSWTYKVNGEFKTLNFFRRDMLPVEEDIDSGGKASINRSLSFKGQRARLNASEGTYKSFMIELIEDIVNSPSLDIFKELDYEFQCSDEDDEEWEEDDEFIDEGYLSRVDPDLDDDALADAKEVKEWIDDFGLINYWDSLVNPFHIGNHKAIYRKHLGGFNVISGKGSYFISTKAKSNVGKSLEDEIAFLMMIPDRYIFKKNQMTLASFSRYSDINVRYFERMLIYFGDLGNKKAYEKIEEVFDAIKVLITEGYFSRDLTEGNSSSMQNKTLELMADSIGAIFQTVRFDFLGDEEEQIASRSIESNPIEANDDEVLDFLFALKYPDSYENKSQKYAMEEISKYHNYLLWLVKEDIQIIIPYRRFFKRFVKNSDVIFRDFNQIIELFEAFCILTHGDCIETPDGLLIASPDQLMTFISELSLDNTLPPVESNFLKMLISEGNKSELRIIEDSDDDLNPIAEFENDVMEHLGFLENLKKYEYESFSDLDFNKRQTAISKLLEFYRLGGTGLNHKENVFFRVNDVQRIHSSKRAFRDIDDVGALLNKLYSNLYLDKLEYQDKDSKGRNIYYLTNKCKEILNPIRLENADIIDANKFLASQDIEYAISYEIKAESEEINAE